MAKIIEIINVQRLLAKLNARAAEAMRNSNVSAVVGFTAEYAIFVHEDLGAAHTIGQAKFLESPARSLRRVLAMMIAGGLRRGLNMGQSLLLAALHLQREAQLLTPVDTGYLRASAFTRLEKGKK